MMRMFDTWDHGPIFARVQEGKQEGKSAENFAEQRKTKKWTAWRPRADEQKIEFKKK